MNTDEKKYPAGNDALSFDTSHLNGVSLPAESLIRRTEKMTDYFEKLVRANFRYGRMRSCCCPLINTIAA